MGFSLGWCFNMRHCVLEVTCFLILPRITPHLAWFSEENLDFWNMLGLFKGHGDFKRPWCLTKCILDLQKTLRPKAERCGLDFKCLPQALTLHTQTLPSGAALKVVEDLGGRDRLSVGPALGRLCLSFGPVVYHRAGCQVAPEAVADRSPEMEPEHTSLMSPPPHTRLKFGSQQYKSSKSIFQITVELALVILSCLIPGSGSVRESQAKGRWPVHIAKWWCSQFCIVIFQFPHYVLLTSWSVFHDFFKVSNCSDTSLLNLQLLGLQ